MLFTVYLCGCFLLGWNIRRMIEELGRAMGILLAVVSFILLTVLFTCAQANAGQDDINSLLTRNTVYVQGLECSGSGGLVAGKSGNTYLLTNAHVCECAGLRGRLFAIDSQEHLIPGEITKADQVLDLCAVHVNHRQDMLRLGKLAPGGSAVYTRGYPLGRAADSTGFAVGDSSWDGVIPASETGHCPRGSTPMLGFNIKPEMCLVRFHVTRSSLYVRPGSSGSPVVNGNGELVGVVSSWGGGESEFDAGLVRFEDVKSFLEGL